MKRIAIIMMAVMGICLSGWAQDKPASQNPPAGQASGQASGQPPAPQGKRPAKVNSQDEYNAYKAAVAITDPAAAEKAAEDFATKYPQSEVRPMVYKSVMQRYQQVNNGDKMVEMAKKVLAIDPDDPEALVSVAQVQVEKIKDDSLDKDVLLAEAKKDAERALVTVETDVPASGYPEEQLKMYKKTPTPRCRQSYLHRHAGSLKMRWVILLSGTYLIPQPHCVNRNYNLIWFGWVLACMELTAAVSISLLSNPLLR